MGKNPILELIFLFLIPHHIRFFFGKQNFFRLMDRLLGFFWLRFTLAKPHLSNPTKTKTPFVGANLAIRLSRLSCIYKHHDSWEGEGGGFLPSSQRRFTFGFWEWLINTARVSMIRKNRSGNLNGKWKCVFLTFYLLCFYVYALVLRVVTFFSSCLMLSEIRLRKGFFCLLSNTLQCYQSKRDFLVFLQTSSFLLSP